MAGNLIVEFGVTDACNLGCKYCYSKHSQNYMDFEVADKFFEIIPEFLKIYDKTKFHISYFGGEPLKNWEIIEHTLPKFASHPKCHSIVLISNGLLLNQSRVSFLKKYKCGLSWSFDGIWSNSTRPLANGGKSFSQYENLIPLAKQLTQSCKVMVSPRHFKTLTENFKFFFENSIFHPDFCLVRDDIYTDAHLEIYDKEIKRLADFIIDLNLRGKLCSAGFFTLYTLDTLASQVFGKRNHGCFVGSGGIMYAYDGSIWPCERFRSSNHFCLMDTEGKLNFENIEILKNPQVSNPQTYSQCRKCELYEVCNAGCTWSQLREFGGFGNLNKNVIQCNVLSKVCELFKMTYREAFRIFEYAGENYKNFIFKQFNNGFNN